MTRSARFFCFIAILIVIGATLIYVVFAPGKAAFAYSQTHVADNLTLDLIGYNYTNYHIEDYEVDNQNGGIVRVSSPTSGGSGSVCCISLSPDKSGFLFVRVRWQVGGCSYIETDPATGSQQELHHYIYKEKYVEVARPVGIKPNHLETHFFPDGSVEVQITEEMSLPRLRLSEDRVEKLKFLKCKNGEKPE